MLLAQVVNSKCVARLGKGLDSRHMSKKGGVGEGLAVDVAEDDGALGWGLVMSEGDNAMNACEGNL